MENPTEHDSDIFKEAIEKGLKALERLKDNKEFVKYHLDKLKEALDSVFEDNFYISFKQRYEDDSISLLVNTKSKEKIYVIAEIFFDGSSFEKFSSDFKNSAYNVERDDLVPYLNNILEDNYDLYWKLTSKHK